MSERFGFRELLGKLERLALERLELEPRPLPNELSSLAGEFRGRPARLTARAYAGRRHAYARFVELVGDDLEIANVLIVGRPELGLPVFGVDLVALGKEKAVVVADLSPMSVDPVCRQRQRAALEGRPLRPSSPTLDVELPAWAKPWFSQDALCVRVSHGESAEALLAVAEMADAYVQLSHAAVPMPERREAIAQRHDEYSSAHRADDRGLLLLRRIFEPEVADRFLCEVLFPQRIPA